MEFTSAGPLAEPGDFLIEANKPIAVASYMTGSSTVNDPAGEPDKGDPAVVQLSPIEQYLPDDASWRGTGGDYVVTLGAACGAERGTDAGLPTLTATVNAFTRLWLGVGPPMGLAFTDDLDGPRDLLEQLDHVLRLPAPHPDWDF